MSALIPICTVAVLILTVYACMEYAKTRSVKRQDADLIAKSAQFLGEWANNTPTVKPEPDGDVPYKSQMAQRTAQFRQRILAEEAARKAAQNVQG